MAAEPLDTLRRLRERAVAGHKVLTPLPRPAVPPGPYLIVGLGRAGRAAAEALVGRVDGGQVSAWDGLVKPQTRAAKRRLSAAGGRVELRGEGLELLDGSPPPACVVKSPGLHPTLPLLAEAAARGIPILDESELGWRLEARPVIGITGTNGKSTLAHLACLLLRDASAAPVLGGNTIYGPALSALGSLEGDCVVAELSSAQLEFAPALLPEVAVLSGFSTDHLKRHGTMAQYGECKRRIFVRGERSAPVAVINVDSAFGRRLAREVEQRGGRVLTYGATEEALFRLRHCTWGLDWGELSGRGPGAPIELRTRLPGRHNAINAVGALALAEALGVDADTAVATIEGATGLPARFERASTPDDPFDVVLDFAHNPEGMRESLLTARRALRSRDGRLLAVVSSLSLASTEERREMGRVAAELADRVIVTIGTAGRSAARRLPQELHEGAAASNPGAPCEVIRDRGEAIAEALRAARRGDLVLVVGRGDAGTPVRTPSGEARPFDDRAAIRELLGSAGRSTS